MAIKFRTHTIQIIPEGSAKVRSFTIPSSFLSLLLYLFIALVIVLIVLLFKLADINRTLTNAEFYKETNLKLIEKHKEYEMAFKELDSIYLMESQIHNILETYLENDSHKVMSILDKNRFHHTPSQKTQLHFDFLYHPTGQDSLKKEDAPSIVPIIGTVSQKFDAENAHQGLDLAAPVDEPVYATQSGNITFTGDKGDLGMTIEIKHNKTYITRYSHLGRYAVKKGDYVRQGEVIGFVGLTGNTSGPHLHYEVLRNGEYMDPENYFNHY